MFSTCFKSAHLPVYWKSIKKCKGVRSSKFKMVVAAGKTEGSVRQGIHWELQLAIFYILNWVLVFQVFIVLFFIPFYRS